MMCLMIEQVVERRRQPLRDGAVVGNGHIGEAAVERRLVEAADELADAQILGLARRAQPSKVAEQDGVEAVRGLALVR